MEENAEMQERGETFGVPWPDLNDGLTYSDDVRQTDSGFLSFSSSSSFGFLLTLFGFINESSVTLNRFYPDPVLLFQAQELSPLARVFEFHFLSLMHTDYVIVPS